MVAGSSKGSEGPKRSIWYYASRGRGSVPPWRRGGRGRGRSPAAVEPPGEEGASVVPETEELPEEAPVEETGPEQLGGAEEGPEELASGPDWSPALPSRQLRQRGSWLSCWATKEEKEERG